MATGVAVLAILALALPAAPQEGAHPWPPGTWTCVTADGDELRLSEVDRATLSSCQGEVFGHGEGWWAHAPESRNLPTPESGGTVHVRLEAPRIQPSRFPHAFLAGVLRKRGDDVARGRVLCRRTGRPQTGGEDAGPVYECPAPAGEVSFRFDLPSCATAFLWNLEVPEAGVTGSSVRVSPPISLLGEVAETDVLAKLVPRGLEGQEALADFAGKAEELPEGGAVEFRNVGPGSYLYQLESPDGISTEAPVVVMAGATEVELPALSLPVLMTLGVQVTPPHDGALEPWVLRLLPRGTNRRRSQPISATTEAGGWLSWSGVEAGEYLLLVEDSAGSLWLTRELVLESDETLWLDLPSVVIEGRATRGEEPFVGNLIFGGAYGSRKFTFTTDEDGGFTGVLPEAGSWDVEVSSEESGCAPCDGSPGSLRIPSVEVEEGPSGKAWLDVEIPDTHLSGRVVVAERAITGETVRRLQPGATIFVTRPSGPEEARGRQAQIWSDDGEFQLPGLMPGEVWVGAMHAELGYESEWQAVEIREGEDMQPVELVLREKTSLAVHLVSANGPVGGAAVTAIVPDGKSAQGVSGADGTALLELASGASGTLVVEAPGHGVALEPFRIGEGVSASREVHVALLPAVGSLVLSHLPYDVFREGVLVSERGGSLSLDLFASLLTGSISFGESLTLTNLAPGTYTLCTERGDCWQGVVFPGASTELDLSESRR